MKANTVAAFVLLCALLPAQWHAQIDNPGAKSRVAWVQGLGVPKTLLREPGGLVGQTTDGRQWFFRYVRETGTHWIYTGRVTTEDGERVIDVTLREDQWHNQGNARWPIDRPFSYHQDVVGRLGLLDGELRLTRSANWTQHIPLDWSRLERVVSTNQVTVWHGWRPWGDVVVDWWVTIHARHPVGRLQACVTVDGVDSLEVLISRAELTFGVELASRWAAALQTPVSFDGTRSTVTWDVPSGKVTRCTTPFVFDGTIVFSGDDRDPPIRGILSGVALDGHVYPFGAVPTWTGSAEDIESHVADLDVYLQGVGTSWTTKRRWGARMNPNEGGDDVVFGATQAPEIYQPGGVQLLGWFVTDAIGDSALRHTAHQDPVKRWSDWRWSPESATLTWDDRPDFRVTPEGPARLGVALPAANTFGYRNHDAEHYMDTGPSLYGLTGDHVLGRLVGRRFEMALAYRRREDPWPGVPRSTGRFLLWTLQAGAALGQLDRAQDTATRIARVAVEQWQGGKGSPTAWLKPIAAMGRYYPAPQLAVAPWQEGLGLLGLLAFWDEWEEDLDEGLRDDLRRVLLEASRTSIRMATVEQGRVGWPYTSLYSDAADPDAVELEGPSFNELNSRWPAPSAAVFLRFGSPDDPEWSKAERIYQWTRTAEDRGAARWFLSKERRR